MSGNVSCTMTNCGGRCGYPGCQPPSPRVPLTERGTFPQSCDVVIGFHDLMKAYIDGARDARMNPAVEFDQINRAADAYVKLIAPTLPAALATEREAGPMNANDHFEAVAEIFYEVTGHLAPGKSEAPEAAGDPEERQRLWKVFTEGRNSVLKVYHLSAPAPVPSAGEPERCPDCALPTVGLVHCDHCERGLAERGLPAPSEGRGAETAMTPERVAEMKVRAGSFLPCETVGIEAQEVRAICADWFALRAALTAAEAERDKRIPWDDFQEVTRQHNLAVANAAKWQSQRDELTHALGVLGVLPPENDDEEWMVVVEDGPRPAGASAIEAAQAMAEIDTRAAAQRDEAVTERDALRAEREQAGTAWKQGGISPRQKDGSWIMCLGYHEERDEYEWGEVVLKSELAEAVMLAGECRKIAEEAADTVAASCCSAGCEIEGRCRHADRLFARLTKLTKEGT